MTEQPNIVPAQAGPLLMQIADRVLGRPLMMHPQKVDVILHILQGRLPIDGTALAPLGPDASRFTGATSSSRTFRIDGGVAVISIVGSLVNRGAWIGANSGATSYEGLSKQLTDAAADPKVKGVILDIDSPGGEATGMFTLAAKVREVAAIKPVVAVVNDMAASAAYGIASQCTEIVVSPTSMVGSIGVVLTHLDRSSEMEKRGVAATLIYAGAHKVDGHPFGALSDGVKADLQKEVGKFYDQFVGLVAQGRGDRLTEQAARATEARTYLGQEAIDMGLADRMASFEAVLASLQTGTPQAGKTKKGGPKMADENAISTEANTAAVTAARADGVAEGRKLGASDATARIGAILGSDAAKGKTKLAMSLAFDTDMSADAADKVLANAGLDVAEAPQAQTRTPGPGQRAEGLSEMGGDVPKQDKASKAASGWAKAALDANKMIGAA
jgi:capsid assembly protease